MTDPKENPQPRTIKKATAFIDYKPAELRKGKDWVIVYYAKNPFTNEMERHRLRAPKISNTREREAYAKRIIAEINNKLANNEWSPYMEKPGNSYKSFKDATDGFLNLINKELKDGVKREDTIRAYTSYVSMVHRYIKAKNIKIQFAGQFDVKFVSGYLDWVYYDRNNSPTTYNNHLRFLGSFSKYFISRGFITTDPTSVITPKPKTKKIRTIVDEDTREIIREHLPSFNWNYFVLCMLPYYSMVRRTELTKLKVSHIDLANDVINLPETISKNRKNEGVTIPLELKPLLEEHIKDANRGDFVFSANNFRPGAEQLKPKKISDTFVKFKKKYSLPETVQWYSLKDTGITDLFMLGSLSATQIRDQARHKDLKTTMLYVSESKAGDIFIKNSGAKF